MITFSKRKSILKLHDDDIHLWITHPQCIHQADLLARYENFLTEEELQKQLDYVFTKERHNALITRAFIRDLLSHYVDIPPAFWQFGKERLGKPKIINSLLPLRFNISHSDNLIICAVTLNNDIGCDVEMIYRNCKFMAIAENNFSEIEFLDLLNQPKNKQRSRFFDYWTLKESYIKALGLGLVMPLADLSFRIESNNLRQYNENIHLSLPSDHFDHTRFCRSWLFYPHKKYRVAVSIKAQSSSKATYYRYRYFENTPLVKTTELKAFDFNYTSTLSI